MTCNIIKDLLPLYYDEICSEETSNFVEEHLEECSSCKEYLNRLSTSLCNNEEDSISIHIDYAKKFKQYKIWQVILFILLVLNISTLFVPWFNYLNGFEYLTGLDVLLPSSPSFSISIIIFIFTIWYNFKHIKTRVVLGTVSLLLMLVSQIYCFLSWPTTSTTGMNILLWNISLNRVGFNIEKSFQGTMIGFYLSLINNILLIIAFQVFIIFCKNNGSYKNKG